MSKKSRRTNSTTRRLTMMAYRSSMPMVPTLYHSIPRWNTTKRMPFSYAVLQGRTARNAASCRRLASAATRRRSGLGKVLRCANPMEVEKATVGHSLQVNLLVNLQTPARLLCSRTKPEVPVIVAQLVICLSARSATGVASLATSVGIARCQTLGVRHPSAPITFMCSTRMQAFVACMDWPVLLS